MAKRIPDFIGKIYSLVKIGQEEGTKNLPLINKASQAGNGGFSPHRNRTQSFEGQTEPNSSQASRDGDQKTHVETQELQPENNNVASTNQAGDSSKSSSETSTNGCPVSLVTGEELLNLDDANLPGALPFKFSRLYRTSSCEINTGLGYGWSHSLNHTLLFKDEKVFWFDNENKRTQLNEPTKQVPAHQNKLAGAAIFLGKVPAEYVLVQSGSPTYHFERIGDLARLKAISDAYNNRLDIEYDEQGLPLAVVNPAGIALCLVYEQQLLTRLELRTKQQNANIDTWHVERVCQTYQYNDVQQLISNKNAAGEGESYQYDKDNVISERKMAGGVTFGWKWQGKSKQVRCVKHWSNTGYQASFDWDDETGNVFVSYADGSREEHTHDANAHPVRTVDPDGAVHLKEFDQDGNLTKTVDPLGNEIHHHYNTQGQRVATVSPDGSVTEFQYWKGNLRKVIQDKAQWRYKYNCHGDITEKRDPLGYTTQYFYNQQGNVDAIHYPDGSIHKLRWNRLGMLVGETYPDGSEIQYRHDIFGRVVYQTSPAGGVTQYTWDDADRLIMLQKPGGAIERFEYNAYGKITKHIDAKGAATEYDYEPNSHLVSRVIHPDGTSLHYQYQNIKRFVSQITNERGEQYQIDYFSNGLVKQETTFDGRQFNYQYDLNGKLLKKTEVGTQGTELITEYQRDVMGRVTEKTLPDGDKVSYQYDERGRLLSVDDGHTPLAWRYDLLGQLVEEHQGWASNYYDYDALGQLKHWQLPDTNRLDYQRDKGGALAAIHLNEQLLTRHDYQHGLEKLRQQGALTSQFEHDEQGRLTAHYRQQQGQILHQRDYQYDGQGNLSQISDSDWGDTFYDYDPLARLTAVRGNQEERFAHDPAGNLIEHKLGPQLEGNHVGANGNQLTFFGDRHFEYDEFGRLSVEKRGKEQKLVTHYHYDCQHRLTKVELPDQATAEYQYDAFGRRIKKTITDRFGEQTRTDYVWQGDNLIAESSGSHYQTYLYEPNSFKPLALIQGEGEDAEVYHYQLDYLGTPQALTSQTGKTVWSGQYRAYGSLVLAPVEDIHNPLRFQGQYFDAETSLHYNRHRYYNPSTGRFITADPIGLAGGLNNYQYAPNPTGWVDPLGLSNQNPNCPTKITKAESEVFKEFLEHHDGQFSSPAEAELAYIELRDKQSPWPIGYTPKTRFTKPGERLYMITNTGRGRYPGQFASTLDIPDAKYGRQDLAIIHEWKLTLDRKLVYEVNKSFEVEYGPIGPQINKLEDGSFEYLRGGGQQVKLMYSDFKNAVPNLENNFTDDPYLNVVSNTKLKKG